MSFIDAPSGTAGNDGRAGADTLALASLAGAEVVELGLLDVEVVAEPHAVNASPAAAATTAVPSWCRGRDRICQLHSMWCSNG
ncbi:MAG: hypothetical protein ACH36H_10740 [Candidatus Nanopelagicales bacterium]